DRQDLDHVELAGCDQRHAIPRSINAVDMTPAVAFTQPEELLAIVNPAQLILKVEPGFIMLGEDRPDLASFALDSVQPGGDPHDANRVLKPVQLLDDDLLRVARPFHEGDVILARVAGDVRPTRHLSISSDDADLT